MVREAHAAREDDPDRNGLAAVASGKYLRSTIRASATRTPSCIAAGCRKTSSSSAAGRSAWSSRPSATPWAPRSRSSTAGPPDGDDGRRDLAPLMEALFERWGVTVVVRLDGRKASPRRTTGWRSSFRLERRCVPTRFSSPQAAFRIPKDSDSSRPASSRDARGRIVVDENFRTSAEGIYAAGDVLGPDAGVDRDGARARGGLSRIRDPVRRNRRPESGLCGLRHARSPGGGSHRGAMP